VNGQLLVTVKVRVLAVATAEAADRANATTDEATLTAMSGEESKRVEFERYWS
jgi:hypothetical protein